MALPPEEVARRSVAYWDPLASSSYLSATTSRIRLVAWLVVLGYHHPVELAKRYGQLDLMSDGRLVLGVGVGTLQKGFELIGATFEGRGARADDAIRALRAVWGRDWANYEGDHYSSPSGGSSLTPPYRVGNLGRWPDAALAPACHRVGRRLDALLARGG